MWDMLLSGATAVSTGGASALAGGLFGGLLSWFKGWQENRHEFKMAELKIKEKDKDRAHDLACMDREADNAERLAIIRSEGEQSVAELSALETAINAEAQGGSWSKEAVKKSKGFWAGVIAFMLAGVDVIRGLIRPLLTVYLVGLVTAMFLELLSRMTGMDNNQAFVLIVRIVDMTLFLTCTAVGFWFGSRGTSKRPALVAR